MREAIEAFEQDFAQWDLHLPADAITTKRGGQIRDAGWSIRYNFGSDARGEYLDYYATGHEVVDNPPGDDLHVRIYASGERVALPTVLEAYMYGRDPTWEELERARRKYEDQLGGAPPRAGIAVTPKAPPAEAPKPPAPRPSAPQHPASSPAQRGTDSTADAGVVGLPPLDAPDTYLALDIGLDLDLDIDLDPGTDEAAPSPEADLGAPAATPPTPAFTPVPAPEAPPAPDPVALADDLTPRQPVEMVDVVLADDWTITADQTAAWDSPGGGKPHDGGDTPDVASDPATAGRSKGALAGLPPDERAAIEIDASAAPPSSLDEVREGDLVLFIPTSRISIETNPADIPEAHQFVEDATAAIMSAPPAARTEPPSGRPTSQPPAEAVAALTGLGIGGGPPRREPQAKPPAKPSPQKPAGTSRVSTAATSRPADNEFDDVDDGLPVDAEMFKPWWFRSGGRRKAMIIAATASVLLAMGLVLAHVMHWPLPGSAGSDAAQAVDSVNAASAADHPDPEADSAESTEAATAGASAGADSETGAGANTGSAAGTPAGAATAADNTAPPGSAPGEGGIVKPAGPNSVPAIVPSRRPGARPR